MGRSELEAIVIPGTDAPVVESYATLSRRAKDATFGLVEDEVVVLDTETTGINPEGDEIIQIAAAIMRGPVIISRFNTYVNPQRNIPPDIVELTRITQDMVRDAPTIDIALRDFAAFAGDRDLIAHNASFDRRFLMKHARSGELTGDWLDSLELARIALPRLRTHKLESLSIAFDTVSSSHRADDDVAALCGVWRVLLVALSDFPAGLLDLMVNMRPSTPWPMRKVLRQVAGVGAGTGSTAATATAVANAGAAGVVGAGRPGYSLRVDRAIKGTAERYPAKDDPVGSGRVFPSAQDVASCFSPDSVVGEMYEDYEPRSEQVAMGTAVLDAFSTGTYLAIEAGTGVGKSIAYLLPSALIARDMNFIVGISTKSNTLTDQLVYHELPALSRALVKKRGGRPLRYVALKGYEHYPCLRKISAMAATDPEVDPGDPDDLTRAQNEMAMLATLYAFSAQSTWGELDSLNLYWKELPRAAVAASAADCMHRHCPFFPNGCFIHGLRKIAETADIVVTNHALLFRDVTSEGGILPPIRYWVIDEAHSADSEARKQLSPSISATDIDTALFSLFKSHSSILPNIRRKAGKSPDASELIAATARAEEAAKAVDTLSTSFFSFVKDLGGGNGKSGHDSSEIWVSKQTRESGTFGSIDATGRALAERLKKLIDACNEVLVLVGEQDGLTEIRGELMGVTMSLSERYQALILFINGDDEGYAYTAKVFSHPEKHAEELSAKLIDVGEELAKSFYPRTLSVVYTSATIAAGDSFDHFATSIGFDRLEGATWKGLRMKSSYDYNRNMTVFIPSDVPEPSNHVGGGAEELVTDPYYAALEKLLVEVHRAMGGSTLTLFTNRRDMERLYRIVRPRLEEYDLKLLCQLSGIPSKRLHDEFIADKTSSLFALNSFREGFDAPGDTLRCVIIPRLSFSQPDDPLQKERERVDRDAWRRYVLPEAVINLKQAAGRLIRSSTDWGYLVIADSRVISRGYGKTFMRSLPSQSQFVLPTDEICERIRKRGEDDEGAASAEGPAAL